ncbi:MAG: T9SS C-terminal target domain-containing protein [Flavobacteriales bacterium TMED191]|nr:MAG: T9SS C-terminal target domain-containing protein [Flavobacteriales bacterium TMED191]|tara:strand:+ start:224 stop:2677 length:2454 start_codon:yes stop_codon:yes gene_type:complete
MRNFLYPIAFLFALSLSINNSLLAQCTINDATDCQCLDPNETDCDLLPDIQLSWFGIIDVSDGPTEYSQDYNGADAGRLRISASTPNDGAGPLTVRGVDENGWAYFICGNDTIINTDPTANLSSFYCDNGEEARQITWQRIYHRNSDGSMSYYDRMAGSMTYHPTHGHNHSDDWGVFTLRKMDPNEPNPLNWPIVSDGAKMGFCLMDYGTCGSGENSTYYGHCRDENRYSPEYLALFPEFDDGTNGGTIKLNSDYPNFGLGGGQYGCSPIEQGISAGWLDLYGEWLDDQWINLEPGLCNGIYWIIGEVDRNNDYLESNEDNNWTAVQVELTQQLNADGYNIEIVTDQNGNPNICNGEVITLSPSSLTADEYSWSTGENATSITVSESGSYTLNASSQCGDSEATINVTVNDPVENPISNDLIIDSGEVAELNATGTGNIIWQDEYGNNLFEGESYSTNPLFENTSYYVVNEEVIVEPESFFTGAEEHEGDSEYSGTVYNGGLRFNADSEFILNNVTVYTNTDGERTIELQDINGTVLLSQLVNIPASEQGTVINLNWSVPQGNNLILTTNTAMNNDNFGDNNPMLRRTTDDLPNFPYSIDNVLEITEGMYDDGDGQGFSTSYYYYFYNWDITTLGASCYSDPIEVNVIVGESISGCTDEEACNFNVDATLDDDSCIYSLVGYDCDGNCLDGYIDINGECIFGVNGCTDPDAFNYDENANIDDGSCEYNSSIEEANNYFTVFPNPANDLLNIEFHKSSEDINIIIFNSLGELVNKIHTGNVQNNQIFSIKLDKLSPGIYVVHAIDQNTTIKQLFTINR